MAKTSGPKIHSGLPTGNKIPLQSYMQQLTPKGMSPEQMKQAATLIRTGHGGVPVGNGKGV